MRINLIVTAAASPDQPMTTDHRQAKTDYRDHSAHVATTKIEPETCAVTSLPRGCRPTAA